jgi:hypothetical protein
MGRGRNPFLSRAGFNPFVVVWNIIFRDLKGRNPFLSRAGFNYFDRVAPILIKGSQSLFK